MIIPEEGADMDEGDEGDDDMDEGDDEGEEVSSEDADDWSTQSFCVDWVRVWSSLQLKHSLLSAERRRKRSRL